ncbi:MAG: hypoxanthine phosphoribosyltransferase [Methyloceanibacter sp.]|nr:hypoxanthine phosphoribosyltransferase [Methyloceanibacter sp.]
MQAAGEVLIEPLYSAEDIEQRVAELARDIAASSLNEPLIVAILKGSFIFAADLIRALHREGLAPEIDFLFLASYGQDTVSQGVVKILHDVESPIEGRDVVIVDDILDSGRTLSFAKDLLLKRGAARVLACVLIDKQVKRAVPVEPDFYGFLCPPVFVVGYGMDLAHRYRELPFVGKISS